MYIIIISNIVWFLVRLEKTYTREFFKDFKLHSSCRTRLPGDLTVSKRTGTSNRIEIQFRTFNHLSRPDSFVKLFETLCLSLAQGNEYLGQI